DPAGLVGAHEDEIGLHPSLVGFLPCLTAAGENERHGEYDGEADHDALLSPNRMSICARSRARTSRGAKRANRPFQTSPTMARATRSWGKRASASFGSSPRAAARAIKALKTGTICAITS